MSFTSLTTSRLATLTWGGRGRSKTSRGMIGTLCTSQELGRDSSEERFMTIVFAPKRPSNQATGSGMLLGLHSMSASGGLELMDFRQCGSNINPAVRVRHTLGEGVSRAPVGDNVIYGKNEGRVTKWTSANGWM